MTGYVKGGEDDPERGIQPSYLSLSYICFLSFLTLATGTTKTETKTDKKVEDEGTGSAKKKAEEVKGNTEQQIVPMNNERFTVPEALFHPTHVGINQAGIPETLVQVFYLSAPL